MACARRSAVMPQLLEMNWTFVHWALKGRIGLGKMLRGIDCDVRKLSQDEPSRAVDQSTIACRQANRLEFLSSCFSLVKPRCVWTSIARYHRGVRSRSKFCRIRFVNGALQGYLFVLTMLSWEVQPTHAHTASNQLHACNSMAIWSRKLQQRSDMHAG